MKTIDDVIEQCEEIANASKQHTLHMTHFSQSYDEWAEEWIQLAEWLKELKAYKETWSKLGMWLADTRLAIAPDEFLNDVDEKHDREAQVDMIDTVLEWMDEHEVEAKQNCTDCIIDGTDACSRGAGRAVDDEICGDFIPSRSEIPNTCGDAISRRMAIDAVEFGITYAKAIDVNTGESKELFKEGNDALKKAVERLKELPSAEPRKKGKWKGYNDGDPNWQRDDGSPIFLICSKCHETVINNGSAHWNFCPNCGADMRGEQDG